MNVNWSGLAGEERQESSTFLDERWRFLGGIVGSKADHHAAPYSLTEEFVAVYRMHPLMPDDFVLSLARNRSLAGNADACRDSGRRTPAIAERVTMPDLFYSFGT